MKSLISALVLFVSFSAIASPAPTPPPTKNVVIGLSEVYVPGGFTSTTDAYVIVSGMFPNSCYSWGTPQITTPAPFMHEIRAVASVVQQMCLMVMVPFQKDVSLGILQTGAHTLRFVNGDGTYFEKTITIE